MNEDVEFLRGLMEQPGDAARRILYAERLEERGDPRAEFLRMNPQLDRISFVAWADQKWRNLVDIFGPEHQQEGQELRATDPLRQQRRALGSTLDPEWVAFINTLAIAFEPFLFFNSSDPSGFRPEEPPFAEQIGTRGAVVTFESDFRDGRAFDQGLTRDLAFLTNLEIGNCALGAASCPGHPFICELKANHRPLTGSDVLAALRASCFRSKHIQNLATTYIPFPGYHPSDGPEGPDNDEIHNDFADQNIFTTEGEEVGVKLGELDGVHGELKRYVADGQLWYVLLHTTPEQLDEDFLSSRYVILFGIGLSPNGDRLLGVVTHQVCHNLCD